MLLTCLCVMRDTESVRSSRNIVAQYPEKYKRRILTKLIGARPNSDAFYDRDERFRSRGHEVKVQGHSGINMLK